MTRVLQQIDHVNLVVNDLSVMTRFYEQALGMKVTKRVTISGAWIAKVVGLPESQVCANVVYLDPPSGPRMELIEYVTPVGMKPPGLSLPNTRGLRHLAFRVGDIEAAAATLKQHGAELVSEIQQVPDSQVTYAGGLRKRLVYFHDPEGTLLELCEYR